MLLFLHLFKNPEKKHTYKNVHVDFCVYILQSGSRKEKPQDQYLYLNLQTNMLIWVAIGKSTWSWEMQCMGKLHVLMLC